MALPTGECGPDDGDMKKLLVAVAALGGAAWVAKRFGARLVGANWEERFAAMPDDAPPKWMFRNISEIRRNTERILELLEGEVGDGEPPEAVEGIAT